MPSPIPIFLSLAVLCLGLGIYGVIGPNFYITVFCRMEYRNNGTIDLLTLDERNPLCHTSQIQEQVSSFESVANLVQGIVQLTMVAQWCFWSDKWGRKNMILIIGVLFFCSLLLVQVFRTYWYVFSPNWFIAALVLDHSEALGSLIILYFSDIWDRETYALYVAWFTGCFLLISGTLGSTLGAFIAGKYGLLCVSSISLCLVVVFLLLQIALVKDDRLLRQNATVDEVADHQQDYGSTQETTMVAYEAIEGVAPLGGYEEVEERLHLNVGSDHLESPTPVKIRSRPSDSKSTYSASINEVLPQSNQPSSSSGVTSPPAISWLDKINVFSPILNIFSIVAERDRRNLVLFSIINSLETAAAYSTVYIVALYVQYVYGWTPAELGKVVAFSSGLKFVMVAAVTPVVIKWLNNRLTRNDTRVYKHPLPDIPLIRFSMLCGAIYTTGVALSHSGNLFVALQVVSSLRSLSIPARATFAISLASPENTGKLLGAVEMISKLLQIPATSLFLKIYSLTVAVYPATVLLIVAAEEWICLGLAYALRNYVIDEGGL